MYLGGMVMEDGHPQAEVMVGHEREELNNRLDGKDISRWMALCTLEEWLWRMGIWR